MKSCATSERERAFAPKQYHVIRAYVASWAAYDAAETLLCHHWHEIFRAVIIGPVCKYNVRRLYHIEHAATYVAYGYRPVGVGCAMGQASTR